MPIPKIVVTAAMMAAQVAIGMTRRIKGPRLDSLKTTTAEYGTPIPRFWGMRRFECPIIWAEDLREEKKESKTKGGKYTEYRYYGSLAVLICDHEIDAVKRIWFDNHLVYQRDSTGPISAASVLGRILNSAGSIVKISSGRNMRIYLGTETQEPDPRMEAWCDDRYGANSCPAYRGSAFIVFEDIPLEKFGNRIPNISVEAVTNKAAAFPYDTETPGLYAQDFSGFSFSPGFSRFVTTSGSRMDIWDTATRTLLATGTVSGSTINGPSVGVLNDGRILITTADSVDAYPADALGSGGEYFPTPVAQDAVKVIQAGDTEYVVTFGGGGDNIWYLGAAERNPLAETTVNFRPGTFFADSYGDLWVAGAPQTVGATELVLQKIAGNNRPATDQFIVTLPAADFPVVAATHHEAGHFVVHWGGTTLYKIDDTTGAVLDSTALAYGNRVRQAFLSLPPGSDTIWIGFNEVDLETLDILRTYSGADWVAGAGGYGEVYDPINHALIASTGPLGTTLQWLYLDRIANGGVTLQNIVDDVSGWCGLTGQDTSALTQVIEGYSVVQGSGKDMIAPLLDIHDVDARPHDFQVQFVNRGSAPASTLLTEDFVRESDPRYRITVAQDTDLPRRITVNFADPNADQQTNTAVSQRVTEATDSTREETTDLSTYVADAAEAQQLADRRLRRLWNERERVNLSLTAMELALEPGDVHTLSLDGNARTARLDKLTVTAGGVLETEWIRDDPAVHVLSSATGSEMDGRDPDEIYIPGPTKGMVLDIPLVTDSHADINPLLYVTAGNYGAGSWPGAVVYEGPDYEAQAGAIESTDAATWGHATTVLAAANANLWDRGNSVMVNVIGTLTSTTEAAIDADTTLNLFALGADGRWEIGQFTTATLTGTSGEFNVYSLSGLKRGRRGTEWAVGTHAVGDYFVMLAGAQVIELGSDHIGDALSYKIQSLGRDPDAAPANDLTFTGATLKPYAPARVKWTLDGTDYDGEIIRRTRVGGAWVGGTTIPLAENSEEYEVDVMVGGNVARTITVSGTNTFTYTAAQAATDGSAMPPTVNVYQISDAVGRGFALAA